jgi:hypothetical protein
MRGVKLAFLAGLLLAFPCSAFADTLIQFVAGNLTDAPAPIGLTPFDHTLGTLTSVGITINGELISQVHTFPNFDGFGNPVPIPFTVFLDQNFFGVPDHAFFGFVNPAVITLNGLGSGVGEQQTIVTPINYGFHFDSSTDLLGLTSVPGVGLASGTLAGFTDTFSPVMFELLTTFQFGTTGGASLISSQTTGAIIVEYDYTPAAPASVPEPGTALLLGAGLAGVLSARARKLRA